jgi:mono/diheme cytochrome c family protein
VEDQVTFVIEGSEDAKQYGVNGLGTGRMPSFGGILSQSQIELIVMYERTL